MRSYFERLLAKSGICLTNISNFCPDVKILNYCFVKIVKIFYYFIIN